MGSGEPTPPATPTLSVPPKALLPVGLQVSGVRSAPDPAPPRSSAPPSTEAPAGVAHNAVEEDAHAPKKGHSGKSGTKKANGTKDGSELLLDLGP
jgi:hypothetical protein